VIFRVISGILLSPNESRRDIAAEDKAITGREARRWVGSKTEVQGNYKQKRYSILSKVIMQNGGEQGQTSDYGLSDPTSPLADYRVIRLGCFSL